jgi:hypothetical protein
MMRLQCLLLSRADDLVVDVLLQFRTNPAVQDILVIQPRQKNVDLPPKAPSAKTEVRNTMDRDVIVSD